MVERCRRDTSAEGSIRIPQRLLRRRACRRPRGCGDEVQRGKESVGCPTRLSALCTPARRQRTIHRPPCVSVRSHRPLTAPPMLFESRSARHGSATPAPPITGPSAWPTCCSITHGTPCVMRLMQVRRVSRVPLIPVLTRTRTFYLGTLLHTWDASIGVRSTSGLRTNCTAV